MKNFPNILEKAEVSPIFKQKNSRHNKENYRPISVLPSVNKIFERILTRQLNTFFKNKFSIYLGGFRKGFNTQNALTRLIESWKRGLNEGKIIGAILMDLLIYLLQ